jgi:hypothetical protein
MGTLKSVLLTGGWTIAWRRFHARYPLEPEIVRGPRGPRCWCSLPCQGGSCCRWFRSLSPLGSFGVWWDYRPTGRGTRLL